MRNPSSLFLCLCVRHFYVQAYLRLNPHIRASPVAVIDDVSPVTTVIDTNELADIRGISIGMTSVHAGLDPELVLIPCSSIDDATSKLDIVQACFTISPLIEDCSTGSECILVLDITACFAIYNSIDELVKQLLAHFFLIHMQAAIVVSSNFHTCRLLAQADTKTGTYYHVARGQERTSLAELPVTSLDLSFDQKETFANWGISTLSDLASLPLDELVSRMGNSAESLFALARGSHTHVLQPIAQVEIFKEQTSFDSPIDLFESLLFSLSPMLDKLVSRAINEMRSIASVTLEMTLADRSIHIRHIQPAVASTSTQFFIKLIHLDLEAHPPRNSVIGLTLTAALGSSKRVQLGMFSPHHPETSKLDVTLARIRKIVGPHHAGSPSLEDSHHQRSYLLQGFETKIGSGGEASGRSIISAKRVMKVNNPILVRVQNNAPASFVLGNSSYEVIQVSGPWRSTGQWWSSNRWNLEHWDAVATSCETHKQMQCCLALDRDKNCWSLDGIYD